MLKPLGSNVLVKIHKPKSSIALLPGSSSVSESADLKVEVVEVGTDCSLGIQKGHEILMPVKVNATIVEQTDDYDLLIISEKSIPAVRNWKA